MRNTSRRKGIEEIRNEEKENEKMNERNKRRKVNDNERR